MKKLILALSVLFILSSCDKENSFDLNTFPQKWELVSMRGNIANAKPSSGNDLPYQENYLLNGDSTFVKTRIRNEVIETSKGTFTIKKLDNKQNFVFKYATKNDLIGSCSGLEEYLNIESNISINNNWWQACDGPGLEYKRVQ